jgi:hypothetical protein
MHFRIPVVTSHLPAIAMGVCLGLTHTLAIADNDRFFNRIATFPVYLNTDINDETVAEIVDASKDGKTLVYTDSETGQLGFVDITKPAEPKPLGAIEVGGEPTSVAVAGNYALVTVNTSPIFFAPRSYLHVIDIESRVIVATHDLAGQADSVAVSPDGRYAAAGIENERDEELGDDEPSLAPSGLLQIVDLTGEPADWMLREVNLDGLADLLPGDTRPEYVDISRENIAVVTLQKNNHIVLVDLKTGDIVNDFSAGSASLTQIDTVEEDPALISLTDTVEDVPRAADGVTWIDKKLFATADEGDRGATIYATDGNVVFTSGNTLEHLVVRLGHYPDDRSGNKGNEPEDAEFAQYGDDRFLFVASERSSVVFVYHLTGKKNKPVLVQTLPTGVKPEGIKAIPGRNLFVAASEKDDRGNKFRGTLTIYQLEKGDAPDYPTIVSADRDDGTPIPWASLSGFATNPEDADTLYTIHDGFYQQSRIYKMDIAAKPAVIRAEIVLHDGPLTVDLDPEGIAVSSSGDGSFWIASEGAGSVDDPDHPVSTNNVVVHAAADGAIIETVSLPAAVNDKQRNSGLEGVASVMEAGVEALYVAFQRAWVGDPEPENGDAGGKARIGRYDTSRGNWTFAYYPLDVRESPYGGWVGLSEITALGEGEFALIERDNQANTDARIKRVYKIDVDGVNFRQEAMVFDTLNKTLVRDLLPDLEATNGLVLEKIESLAVTEDGDMLFANDNDGVNDSSGETQLIRVKNVFKDKDD